MEASLVVTLVLMVAILASDFWIYVDATAHEERGRPVIARVGALEVARPQMWLTAVVIVWVLFFPLYIVARKAS
jgi:hypothetical protein